MHDCTAGTGYSGIFSANVTAGVCGRWRVLKGMHQVVGSLTCYTANLLSNETPNLPHFPGRLQLVTLIVWYALCLEIVGD